MNLPMVVVLPCCRLVIQTKFSHRSSPESGPAINAYNSGDGRSTPVISPMCDAVSRFKTAVLASNMDDAHGAFPR